MDYIVVNNTPKREIILSMERKDGKILYEGHKWGIPDEMFPYILRHHHEIFGSSFLFFDYKKWKSFYNMGPIVPTMNCWIKNKDSKKGLLESYNTLLDISEEIFGKFRNIFIIEI